MSQRCSSEEHHARASQPGHSPQPAARNDAALGPTGRPPGATVTWEGEGGRDGGGLHSAGRDSGAAARDWKGQRPQTLQGRKERDQQTTFSSLV